MYMRTRCLLPAPDLSAKQAEPRRTTVLDQAPDDARARTAWSRNRPARRRKPPSATARRHGRWFTALRRSTEASRSAWGGALSRATSACGRGNPVWRPLRCRP